MSEAGNGCAPGDILGGFDIKFGGKGGGLRGEAGSGGTAELRPVLGESGRAEDCEDGEANERMHDWIATLPADKSR